MSFLKLKLWHTPLELPHDRQARSTKFKSLTQFQAQTQEIRVKFVEIF